MGYALAALRLVQLKSEQLDLEYKIQLITNAKMSISKTISDLVNIGTDLEPDSVAVKKLEQRRERLYLMEKKLDMQMEEYTNRLKAVEAEYQSCKSLMDKNLQSSFSY